MACNCDFVSIKAFFVGLLHKIYDILSVGIIMFFPYKIKSYNIHNFINDAQNIRQ